MWWKGWGGGRQPALIKDNVVIESLFRVGVEGVGVGESGVGFFRVYADFRGTEIEIRG